MCISPRSLLPLVLVAALATAVLGCAQPTQAPTTAAPPAVSGTAAPAVAAPAAPTRELPLLRVAYVSPVAAMAPLWMAKESGAFDRAGVPVEVRYIQANAAIAALIAGEVDLLEISGPAVLSAVLQGGADIVFIAGALNQMIFTVHTTPAIHSPQELKGKLFGTDRPGTPVGFVAEVAIEKMGLQPSDLQVLNIGSSDQLLAALLSGQLASTVLGPPANFVAEDAGFPSLIDLYDVPYQNIGIAGRRERLPALEPSLVPFLRAFREGMERYNSDKALALEVIGQYSQESNPEVLDKTYEFYRRAGWNLNLGVSEQGIASIAGYLEKHVPNARSIQVSQVFDGRYAQQVR